MFKVIALVRTKRDGIVPRTRAVELKTARRVSELVCPSADHPLWPSLEEYGNL